VASAPQPADRSVQSLRQADQLAREHRGVRDVRPGELGGQRATAGIRGERRDSLADLVEQAVRHPPRAMGVDIQDGLVGEQDLQVLR
jgi:hypothetical protein